MSVENDAADGQRKDPSNEEAAENASTPISEIKCNAQNGERSNKIEKEAFLIPLRLRDRSRGSLLGRKIIFFSSQCWELIAV